MVDLSTGQIYPDAVVRACGIADINCESPVTDFLPVDAEGWVDIPLFRDFIGFLEVRSEEAVPYLFYLSEPLTVRAFDCMGNTASNVMVSSEGTGVPWYFVDGLPNGSVSETGTDGLGGLANVQPGIVVFDAMAPTGVSIRGPQSVVVRPNWMSVAFVRPREGLRQTPP